MIEGLAASASPAILMLVVAAYAIGFGLSNQFGWTRFFLIVIFCNTIARQLHYAIGLRSLPAQLRCTPRQPYLAFLVITVADFLTLLLTLNAIINWNDGPSLSAQTCVDLVKRFYLANALDLVKGVLKHQEPPLADVLITGAGFLYNTTLLKTLLSFRDFKRTDEDYTSLATSYNALGRYTEALAALEKIRQPTVGTYLTKAGAYIGVSQLDLASDQCKVALSMQQIDGNPRRILTTLFGIAGFLPLPTTTYLELLRRGMASDSDAHLVGPFAQFLGLGLSPEQCRSLFVDTATPQNFPLCYAQVLIGEGKAVEAASWLGQLNPQTPPEKVFYSYLLLFAATIANPNTRAQQDLAYFDDWTRQHLDEFTHLVSNPAGQLDDLELVSIFMPFVWTQLISSKLQSHYEQSWLYVLKLIKDAIERDKLTRDSLGALTKLESMLRSQFRA